MERVETVNKTVTLADYQPHPRNYNRHPAVQVERIAKSLQKFGQVRSVVVWNGYMLAGHGVREAALELGWDTIRADVLPDDYPEHLALAYVAADNELGRMADPDQEQLAAILSEARAMDDELLEAMGYDESELTALMAEVTPVEPGADTEPQVDRAEELRQKWHVETGQLWQLGDHRLICGDCTDAAVVERVMQGERAEMVFTDPPYALFGNSTGVAGIVDDKMVRPFFRDIAKMCIENTSMFSHVYICCDWHSAFTMFDVITTAGLTAKNLCVWDKGDGGIGANYQQCYELVWFFANSPKRNGTLGKKATGERTVNGVPNIWRFPRVTTERVHNAEKPVEMVSVPVKYGCNDGEAVLEPFSGSGTTIIACENLGRKCRAIEISPAYVAVALERWAEHTGNTPELIG